MSNYYIDTIAKFLPAVFDSFSHAAEGVYVYICYIPEDISWWSQDAVDYFGFDTTEIKHAGEKWIELIAPEDREAYQREMDRLLTRETNHHYMDYRVRNKNGEYVMCSCKGTVIRDENNRAILYTGTLVNHEQEYNIDPITGLYSKKSLIDHMELFSKSGQPYYLLLFGVRNFFSINSAYGYAYGNRVLKEMAGFVRSIKTYGTVFRAEGTKCALLVESKYYTRNDMIRMFNTYRRKFTEDFEVGDTHMVLDISGGLMEVQDPSMDVNTIYNSALYALDTAKRENKTDLFVVDAEYFETNNQHLHLLDKIRSSILHEFDGFYMVYQPIVDANTEQVTGMEALLRWRDDEYGVVPPNEFIPWLEKDPTFYNLGLWILRQSLRDAKPIIEIQPDFVVNVNIAYPQMQRMEFKQDVMKTIDDELFNPNNLKLELTERCRLIDQDLLRNDMIFFHSSGLQTALDDFGTGYSALELMTKLPVDQIKIDKSFVDEIGKDPSKQSLLRAITGCATELKKNICIEGIETKELAEYLREHFEVANFQGYYFSRPVEIDEFMKYYENTR